ncbi:MAG: diguanylate cyclase [Chloroflexota bacterium]
MSVTVSLGVAFAAPDCPDLPTLLRLADEALYKAKNAGRNRVCWA